MPICDICQEVITEEQTKRFSIWGQDYCLCGWDALRIKQYTDNNITHHSINIYWGAGHIDWSSWWFLRDFIRENNIKEVLEFGSGLSSELFINEGVKLISFDVWKQHAELYQKLLPMKERADFIWYPEGTIPPVKTLYPGRTWDFVFVDGPQERAREVALAMELANKWIYLHDPNMGEQGFFPNDDWKPQVKEAKLFIKGDYGRSSDKSI